MKEKSQTPLPRCTASAGRRSPHEPSSLAAHSPKDEDLVTTQPQAKHRGVGDHHSSSPFGVRARQERIERDAVLVEEAVPLVPRSAASFVVLDLVLKVDEPVQRHLEPFAHTTCVPRSGLKKLVGSSREIYADAP